MKQKTRVYDASQVEITIEGRRISSAYFDSPKDYDRRLRNRRKRERKARRASA